MRKEKICISFLITHYNRPIDLLQCIEAIQKIKILNYEIVVSDDFSGYENIKLLKSYPIDKLILGQSNLGLAANLNKGIKACEGKFIIYCQEDFILNNEISTVLPECLALLNSQRADMIRLRANYEFKKLIRLTDTIFLIPKFSFQNFLLNPYQYSDHPFITTRSFYEKFGYYLDNTSGDYGETEFAIRIFKSKVKVAIIPNKYVSSVIGSQSVIDREVKLNIKKLKINKSFIKLVRALRLYLEWILYDKSKRGLFTYKNKRKNKILN